MSTTISEHQARIYEFMKVHPNKWLTTLEVSLDTNIPDGSVKRHAAAFEEIGILQRIRLSPSHAFRLDPDAAAHAPKLVSRLEEAVAFFTSRRRDWLKREESVVRHLEARSPSTMPKRPAVPAPQSADDLRTGSPAATKAVPSTAAKEAGSLSNKASKGDQLIELLSRPGGATIDELVATFGTKPHSIRAAISVQTRERGMKAVLVDGHYQIST